MSFKGNCLILDSKSQFTLPSERIKYFRISLSKKVKDFYFENYRTVMKEIKDANKWKDILVYGLKNLILLKGPALYKTICNFIAVPIKIHVTFFIETEKATPKFI